MYSILPIKVNKNESQNHNNHNTMASNTIIIYFNETNNSNVQLVLPHKMKRSHDKDCPMILAMELEGQSVDSEDEANGNKIIYDRLIYSHNTHTDNVEKNEAGQYITYFCNRCFDTYPIVCTSHSLDPYHTPCKKCHVEDWVASERFLCDYCIEETHYPVNNQRWYIRVKTVNDYYAEENYYKQH